MKQPKNGFIGGFDIYSTTKFSHSTPQNKTIIRLKIMKIILKFFKVRKSY